jgi:hypothetical protein
MGTLHEDLGTWVLYMKTWVHGYFTWRPVYMGTLHEDLCTWVLYMKTWVHGYFTWRPVYMGTLHEDLGTVMTVSRWILLRKRSVSAKVAEKIRTHSFYSITWSRKSFHSWENVGKYGRNRLAIWQYKTALALCMLDNWGYRHTLRIYNTYCFISG